VTPVYDTGTQTASNRTDPSTSKGPIDYDDGLRIDDTVCVADMKDIDRAIVKFNIPTPDGLGMKIGTGFFVDERGWVATNYHVIKDMTSDARAEMVNGDKYEIAGIIAEAPERDLAVVKLAAKPFQIMIMDINGYMTEPNRGENVFSFGHPRGDNFSLTRGIVSRVLTSDELRRSHPGHIINSINAPAGQVWIQHDSKISQGNSGGPLFNDNCQVMGINSFVHQQTDFGFAAHVRHLRDLVVNASDTPKPLPKGGSGGTTPDADTPRPNLAADEMEKVFDACKVFDWKPGSDEEYKKLCRLAGAMAVATGREDELATTFFSELRDVEWTEERMKAVNKFAVDQFNKVNQGLVVFGKVHQATEQVVLLEIDDTKKFIYVLSPKGDVPGTQRGGKVLLIGLVTPQATLVGPGIYARMVNSRHMKRI
jgi:S1-C subfamily serine protease